MHWIDFITCADSSETPKAIIHANEKSYRCDVSISTAYLTDDPSAQAYIVNLQNMRPLTSGENSDISQDVLIKPAPQAITNDEIQFSKDIKEPTVETPESISSVEASESVVDAYDTSLNIEEDFNEALIETDKVEDSYLKTSIGAPLDIDLEDDFKPAPEPEIEEPITPESYTKTYTPETVVEDDEVYESSYQFDPQIASNELGLPIDLIEEFIEDFITQAKDFKDDLYQSLNDGDIENIHILSHKLKGVAANLRVEDAFEVLTTINTSHDINVVEKNLKHFYVIIAKLSGEEITHTPVIALTEENTEKVEEIPEVEEDFILEFKEVNDAEIETIKDSSVPDKIDIPELADDNFLDEQTIHEIEIDEKSLAVDIETVDTDKLTEEVLEINELPEIIEIEEKVIEHEDEVTLDLLPEIDTYTEEIQEETSYNKTEIANEIGLDQDSFDELLQDYFNDSNELCNSIEDAISSNNSDVWKKEALKLKGMSINMRIDTFSEQLETLLNTTDQETAQDAIKAVSNKITEISNLRD